jgi:DEAD/DEAH box helicase domain-containing protein
MEHAAIGIMPLLVMTDRNDLGGISIPFHDQVQTAAVFVYDAVPGGLGLCRQAFEQADRFLSFTLEAITSCRCDTGCPACVHSPKCGSGNRPIDKHAALQILAQILTPMPGNVSVPVFDLPDTGLPQAEQCLATPAGSRVKACDNAHFHITETRNPFEATELQHASLAAEPSQNPCLRYGVLDIETRRSAAEVGGWNRAGKMGVSCAVLYDSGSGQFHDYSQDQVEDLCLHLAQLDRVVGFNLIRFDYKVLGGLCDFDFHGLPTLDILVKIHETLGYRLSLDHLAQNTLGAQKSADGLMALQWWQEGQLDKIIEYCTQDVRVTRDLYRFGRENRFLVFKNKAGSQVRVPVSW